MNFVLSNKFDFLSFYQSLYKKANKKRIAISLLVQLQPSFFYFPISFQLRAFSYFVCYFCSAIYIEISDIDCIELILLQ